MKPKLIGGLFSDKRFCFAVLWSLLFFGFLWSLDFPKPMEDDLFYTGAGLNMAQGGDFSNPYILRFFPEQHYYFVYPPVHSYVLAGWLKVFGISAATVTGFQITMYFLMASAVIVILRRYEAPPWLWWLVPLIAANAFLGNGLRTEATAVAMTWCGFAVIECGTHKDPAVFFGLLLMFLAGATAPRNAIFDAALIVMAEWYLWQDSAAGTRPRWRFLIPSLAAFGLSVFIFLLMIHFKLGEFWTTFHKHSQVLKVNTGKHFGVMQDVLLALGGVMSLFVWRYRSDRLIQICIAIGVAFCIALITKTLGYGPGSWYALLVIVFLSAVLLKRAPLPGRVALQSGLCVLLFWRIIPLMVEVYGILSGEIQTVRGQQFATARTLICTSERQLYVDPYVARYTFDYRTPTGSMDLLFSSRFLTSVMQVLMTEAQTKPQDTYLLSPRLRDYVERCTYLEHQARARWTWLHWSFDKYPRQVSIIRAEECKGLKSQTERP